MVGILAAIVSVSLGGFTGQATVKSRKDEPHDGADRGGRRRRAGLPGNFPAPAHVVGGKHKLWRWSEVARWFAEYENRPIPDDESAFIASINGVLEIARRRRQLTAAQRRMVEQLARAEELVPA